MQHIWIFQLEKSLPESVKGQLLPQLDAFISVWKAHGTPVPGDVTVVYDRFVVVKAEPGHASGCSIDSMTKGVNDILSSLGQTVLGPEYVFFRTSDGNLVSMDFREVKPAILAGRINGDTIVFDSTLGNSNDLNLWELPLQKTWMGRFLPQQA